MNRLFALSSILLIAAACEVDMPEKIDFAVSSHDILLGVEGGDTSVVVYTDAKVETKLIPSDVSWSRANSPLSFTSDEAFSIHFDANEGLRRSVKAVFSYKNGAAVDTVLFRQAGQTPELTMDSHSLYVDGSKENTTSVAIKTNCDTKSFAVSISYGSGKDWIKEVKAEAEAITVTTAASTSDSPADATIRISYDDGWGSQASEILSVVLSNKSGYFGNQTDFATVKALATGERTKIEDYLILRAIVCSDCSSPNMEMNPNTAYNVVDTSPSEKTAYVESEDGKSGFRLVFKSSEDNKLKFGDVIDLTLNGTTLVKESAPERYTLEDATLSNVRVISTGSQLPAKERKISELKDEDLYTFVTVRNTEFLNKEGSYSNVNDLFTLASSFNTSKVKTTLNTDCWPIMLADSEGSVILAMVNMLCPWRRTGSAIPQGVGDLKGILVHNVQPRFGGMGRYQIRVVDQSGFAQATASGSSFKVFAKWDGSPYKYKFSSFGSYYPYITTNNGMDSVIPSDDLATATGKCTATMHFENKAGQPMSGTNAVRPCRTFDAKAMGTTGGYVDGRGLSLQCNISGFYNWGEDGKLASTNGIRMDFSTSSFTGRMFMYFTFCCGGNDMVAFKNFPSHWCVDYTTDGGATYKIVEPLESDEPYVHLRAYAFGAGAIEGRDYVPSYSTSMGFSEHMYAFPADIAGKEKVSVRIRPYDDVISVIPADPATDIESARASKETSIYQDLRIGRIYFYAL